ncbi:MAG: IS66 family transposase, partial [Mesorhizobium sp.]
TNLVKARDKAGSNETIRLAGCWAHLRRKFYDLHISGISQGRDGFDHRHDRIVEGRDKVRGKDAGSRAALRQEKAIVASPFDLWEAELGKVSGKSKTALRG